MHVHGNGRVTSSATGCIIEEQRQCKEWYHLHQNSGAELTCHSENGSENSGVAGLTCHSENGSENSGVAGLTIIQVARTAVHQNSPQHR